ncbi:hypothetical protein SAMN04487891_101545 [Flagellimonas taeanensis]|uniref:Right handed beta helix region n=1 Tax=Flagellimonas taeanensis TaxID=1005926 RepID=A0A1M6QDP1_9FLAO|nr:hypothetical protein SAMN04487891_101545 [Allomuricauda taeanensis]SHK18183.1 hypothetical protein SAMN05216293_0552 [Allomuricauda taeanensis]
MLVSSKKTSSQKKTIFGALVLLVILLLLSASSKNWEGNFGGKSKNNEPKSATETPTIIKPGPHLDDQLVSGENRIFQKDNLSLFLNNDLGIPTLFVVYSDSLSQTQKNSRFLAFLYLKRLEEWKAANNKTDYILLAKESLIPITKQLGNRLYYVFKFQLEHPYFEINNLKKIEFVRHTREFGRSEEAIVNLEEIGFTYPNPSQNTLKNFQISLQAKEFEKITVKRNQALESGILITTDDDLVKGDISTDGKTDLPVEMRLKGDWTDHLIHPTKWSYRIVPKGEETVFGIRKLSIQHPKSRNFIWEWLFNKVIKDNDLTGLRYDFLNVELKISDIDSVIPMGIMAMEESFDKILIENNRRREGLILALDESMYWAERKQVKDLGLEYPKDADVKNREDLPIKVYNENKVLSSPVLSEQFKIAKNLVVGLRNGELKLSEAFDVDKLALYIALSNLFGGHHGLHTENIRIYYNPVTNKLEPISFDSNSGHEINDLRAYPIGIHDQEFKEKLFEKYELVSSNEFVNGVMDKYFQELNDLYFELSGEFPEANLDYGILQHNANVIKKKINPNTIVGASLIQHDKNQMTLEIRNFAEFPVVMEGLVLENGKSLNQSPFERLIIGANDTLDFTYRLKDAFNNAFVSKKNKEGGFRYPKDLKKIQLKYHILGSTASKLSPIFPYASRFDQNVVVDNKLKNNFQDFEFIKTDEDKGTIVLKTGKYELDKILHIPENFRVEIEAGFNLNLVNNASIISYSPIFCKGTATNPINIYSENGTGGGIFVSSTNVTSIVQHVNFTNLSVPKMVSWSLSGAVNFNEAQVQIKNCVFKKNRSEDALNIIRSRFEIDSIAFVDTFSDSFDGDFGEGSISNSTFTNSGNDGIDVSGSNIEISNIHIENPADKGVSAGEGSTIMGHNVTVVGGEIGMVSKDLSRITLSDVVIENTRLAISCFQKKSEFGPGIIDLNNVQFRGNEVFHLVEATSELIIDNVLVKDKSEKVIDKMYGNQYGKSSR